MRHKTSQSVIDDRSDPYSSAPVGRLGFASAKGYPLSLARLSYLAIVKGIFDVPDPSTTPLIRSASVVQSPRERLDLG